MKPNSLFTEVISISPADSSLIEDCNSSRIELVSALEIGGVTPGYGLIRKSLEAVSIPTNLIIRHHNNGFLYTQQDKNVMFDEIVACKDLFRPAGVVIGSLIQGSTKQERKPDLEFLQKVVREIGGKMTVTFHKASDQMSEYCKGITDILKCKADEILTQGGLESVTGLKNVGNIKNLAESVRNTNILCGGGVCFENKMEIVEKWGISRIHIGTCVREGRYGPVSKQRLLDFMNI